MLTQPERTIYSVKRLMGRGPADVQDELKIFPFRIDPASTNVIRVRLGERVFTPPEISAFILRELKSWAENYFQDAVDRAVITVPAYFNDAQRQATRDAGRLAGLEVLRLVNEPTAAALAYGLHEKKRGRVAVYDFGGGTFDISILKLISTTEGDIYQVLSTNGDTHLGGDDIDNALQSVAREEIRAQGVDLAAHPETVQELRKALIAAKHELSEADKTTVKFPLPDGGVYFREITRAEFDGLDPPDRGSHDGAGAAGAGRREAHARRRSRKLCWSAARRACRWCGARSRNFSDAARTRNSIPTKSWRWARRCRPTFSKAA